MPGQSGLPANATPCAATSIHDTAECCAEPGWPGAGTCTCDAFLCQVNQGGGSDCWYQGQSTTGLPLTTSATGAACCLRGSGICSCYDQLNVSSCQGFTTVGSCTASEVAPCTDVLNAGETPVSTCR